MSLLFEPPKVTEAEMNRWRQRELESRKHDALLILNRLPRKWQRVPIRSLCSWVETEYLETIEQWNWGCGRNVVLLGPSKRGKSTAAAILFRKALNVGVHSGGGTWRSAQRLRWYRAEELLDAQRSYPLGRGEPEELRLARCCSLLFLDEVGWKHDEGVVQTILSARYECELPTVVTSGLGRGDLVTRYGDAVARRMASIGSLPPLLATPRQRL